MKGSRLVSFWILWCFREGNGDEFNSPRGEAEAGRRDLGHVGSSNSNSSRKEKWYFEEEMKWREKNQKKKETVRERTQEPLEKTSRGEAHHAA